MSLPQPAAPGRSRRAARGQSLYGRDLELREISAALQRLIDGESGLVVVSGPAGSGKTALVTDGLSTCLAGEERLTLSQVRVAVAAFEEARQAEPYSALRQVLGAAVRQILAADDSAVAWWREHIGRNLGATVQALVDLIPELAWLAGPQPALPVLEPEAHRQRFYFAVQRFVTAIAPTQQPLILVLENLQWADPGSRQLIAALAEATEPRALLILITFRSDHADGDPPFQPPALTGPATAAATLATIELRPLSAGAVAAWLAAQLAAPPDEIRSLAERLHLRAQGNPLFLTELLAALRRAGGLLQNGASGRWRWDADALDQLALDDDLAGLLARSVNRQPAPTREFLATAALLGEDFDAETLSRAQGVDDATTAAELRPALAAGLIVMSEPATTYRFRHDRVRTAALACLAESQREALHLRIAEALLGLSRAWPSASDPTYDDDLADAKIVFRVAHHLNAAAALITDPARRRVVARLNLQAARQARATAAHEAAWEYSCQARSWLPADDAAWRDDAELAFAVQLAAAEAGYLTGRHDDVAGLASAALEHLSSPVERARVYLPWIQSAIARNELESATGLAVSALRPLGVRLQVQATTANLLRIMAQVRWALRGRGVDDLLELPKVTEPGLQEAARILGVIGNSAYWRGSPPRTALLALQSLQITLRCGLFPTSALGFAGYAAVLCMLPGDVRRAHAFGALAERLTDRPEGRAHRARVAAPLYYVVNHRTRPLRESLEPLLEGHRVGLETGDVESAVLCALCYAIHAFQIGEPLKGLERHLRETTALAAQLGQRSVELPSAANHQAVLNLIGAPIAGGASNEPAHLTGDACDEASLEEELARSGNQSALTALRVRRAHLAYLFGDAATALTLVDSVRPRLKAIAGSYAYASSLALDALIRLDRWDGASAAERRRFERQAAEGLRKLRRWARTAPQNHAQHIHLVQAELARVQGRPAEAAAEFEAALAQCEEHRWIADGAMAAERAARFYLASGHIERGRAHVQRALAYCEQWGALALRRHIERRYEVWLDKAPDHALSESAPEVTERGEQVPRAALALNMLEAGAAAWNHAELPDLLDKTLRGIIRAVSAERAVLLVVDPLARPGTDTAAGLQLAAECDEEGRFWTDDVTDASGEARHQRRVPQRVTNFVVHSRQALVLADASAEAPFDQDPLVVANAIRAVICVPLYQASRLCGVLYVENRRTASQFGHELAPVLGMRGLQAALAIQNARLIAGLAEKTLSSSDAAAEADTRRPALALAPLPAGPGRRVAELLRVARHHAAYGQWQPANARVDEALAEASQTGDPDAWRALAFGFTPELAVLPGGRQRCQSIVIETARLDQSGDEAAPDALWAQRITLAWLRGRIDEVFAAHREALAAPMANSGAGADAASAALGLVVSAFTARRLYDEAQQHFELWDMQRRDRGADPSAELGYHFRRVRLDWLRGLVPASGSLAHARRSLSASPQHPWIAVLAPVLEGIAEQAAGRYEPAAASFRAAVAAEEHAPSAAVLVQPELLLAHARHAQGANDEALDLLSGVLSRCRDAGTPGLIVQEGAALIPLLRLAAQQGRRGPAAAQVLALLGVSNVARRLLVPETGVLLSPRELDVLELLTANASNRAIAERLGVDLITVKSHVTRVLAKLGVQTRHEAAERGRALGLGLD